MCALVLIGKLPIDKLQRMICLLKFGKKIRAASLANHTLRRESGHAATIELLLQWKLAVTNEICTLCRLHSLSWSRRQLVRVQCDQTLPISAKGVA